MGTSHSSRRAESKEVSQRIRGVAQEMGCCVECLLIKQLRREEFQRLTDEWIEHAEAQQMAAAYPNAADRVCALANAGRDSVLRL